MNSSTNTFDPKHVIADGRDMYNFSAGPCVLPKVVLDKCVEEMYNYRGSGQSVMELSHRQDEFRYISVNCKNEIRKFLKVPDNYRIMLQQANHFRRTSNLHQRNNVGSTAYKKGRLLVNR